MRDILDRLDNLIMEKARGLLYRTKGDEFFQGPKENPTAKIVFDKAEYFPNMPGAYQDYQEMATVGQELFKTYPEIQWFNKPTASSRAFAILTFNGPKPGQKTHFGKFFDQIKQDMTGFWKNSELPGGWQLNKASSLKGSYYKLKPSDVFPPDSEFDSPQAVVAELKKNPTKNPAVPVIMPGMEQLLQGQMPTFENVGEMAPAVRDDLGEIIGPIALVQGMIKTGGAEAARVAILGPTGSYAGAKIYFPASKINGLVDSYLRLPGVEIGVSSKGDKGATASVKNIADGIAVARKNSALNELLTTYAEEIKTIERAGKLSSAAFPLVLGVEQGKITRSQANVITQLINQGATSLDSVTMSAEDRAALEALMNDYKPKPNPRYNVGYHVLASLARKVVDSINQDPKFGEACLKFLNVSPIIQLHLKSRDQQGNLTVTGFDSKYPPDFKGTVGLDASKVYSATGTNGRVTFAYNGLPGAAPADEISGDVNPLGAQAAPAVVQTQEPVASEKVLGRKRR